MLRLSEPTIGLLRSASVLSGPSSPSVGCVAFEGDVTTALTYDFDASQCLSERLFKTGDIHCIHWERDNISLGSKSYHHTLKNPDCFSSNLNNPRALKI